ncbi:MAG: SMC-Scp complex subunit ScpB [Candidatus Eremiobacter antarcticus]|nr:SMC-Scp complex subunit ScpB [Candidatus Eremiobacteraeota bacterium]MBC5807178.1 SMC-Scp complex subunit ScpB [Candidatus Eremiobacteraeota bacterium]
MTDLPSRLEAVLFAAADSVSTEQLGAATGASPQQVTSALAELSAALLDRGIVLRELAGGYRLATNPKWSDDVERFLLPPRTHMSQAALETLAIVAYLQPVTRTEVESIRGVNADGVMATLEQRRLIEELGRKDVVGRPILYGTTKQFLETFGFRSLDELPPLPEGAPKRRHGEVIMFPQSRERAIAVEQLRHSLDVSQEAAGEVDAPRASSVPEPPVTAVNGRE